jgi:hypothetical protein
MKGRSGTRYGIGDRYDLSTPGGIDQERQFQQALAGGLQFSPSNTRFCETCQRHIKMPPVRRTKAFKGWKCVDCRAKP